MAKKKDDPKKAAQIKQLEAEIARRKAKGQNPTGFIKKLADLRSGKTTTPVAGPPAPTPEEEKEKEKQTTERDTKDIMLDAEESGRRTADEYVPVGTFGMMDVGTSPEMRQYLDRLKAWSETAGNYTGYEQGALDKLQGGLDGYLAPELLAMREQRLQELGAEQATQQRQMAMQQARSGVRGAYAGAQQANLGRQAVQTRGNMEQDLFVKNADEIQRRRSAFADVVNKTETARFGRARDSNQMYGSSLGGEENTQRALTQFNIGQGQNEALARGGMALAGAGNYTGLYGNVQSNQRAQDQYDLAVRTAADNQAALMKQLDLMRRQINADVKSAGGPAPVTNNTYYTGAA